MLSTREIIYPESDGEPMAENTLQFEWIVTIKEGLEATFAGTENVFVAGDLFWYPVEGRPGIRYAPDILVALGRPKGHRRSYMQWREGGIAPQVVFEVLSPGNRVGEMMRKFAFYQQYGVEEYYVYNPDTNHLEGWRRNESLLLEIETVSGWTSPLLGVRFVVTEETLEIHRPDGSRFLTYQEVNQARAAAEQKATAAERKAFAAESKATAAEQKAVAAEQKAAASEEKAARLAQKLKELGIDPDQVA